MKRLLITLSSLAGLGLGACAHDASRADATTRAPAVGAVSTEFIAMPGGAPEEVVWDDAHQRLLILDNVGNRVWQWTDRDGIAEEPYATLALPEGEAELPANVTLGQAALLGDGRLLVTRFGIPGPDATHGGVVVVDPDGKSELVPELDRKVHRLGIAADDDGTVFVAGFVAMGTMPSGIISGLDLETGEAPVADGFGKLIGLAISGGHLYVSDQSSGKILDAPINDLPAHAADWHTHATLSKPDQICTGPSGSLFSGQFQAAPDSTDPIAVRRISSDGKVTTLRADPDVSKPSGVGYDPTHKRLFVADTGNVARIGVHVFPVE